MLQTLRPFIVHDDAFSRTLFKAIARLVRQATPSQLAEVLEAASGFVHDTEGLLEEYQAYASGLGTDGGTDDDGSSIAHRNDEVWQEHTGSGAGENVLEEILSAAQEDPTISATIGQSVGNRHEAEVAWDDSGDRQEYETSLQKVREG